MIDRTPAEVAQTIRAFLSGTDDEWCWDCFISIRIRDPLLDGIRIRCDGIRDEYPPLSFSARSRGTSRW